jgi:hypothetical protein
MDVLPVPSEAQLPLCVGQELADPIPLGVQPSRPTNVWAFFKFGVEPLQSGREAAISTPQVFLLQFEPGTSHVLRVNHADLPRA